MTIAANIGDVAVLNFDACFPDSVVGFIPQRVAVRDFLYYMFRAMRYELSREAPINTQGNLNIERIGSLPLLVPPLSEQKKIVRAIEDEAAILDTTAESARSQIELLQEYRTRLISDVVTGKLDVREAANLPGESALSLDPDGLAQA